MQRPGSHRSRASWLLEVSERRQVAQGLADGAVEVSERLGGSGDAVATSSAPVRHDGTLPAVLDPDGGSPALRAAVKGHDEVDDHQVAVRGRVDYWGTLARGDGFSGHGCYYRMRGAVCDGTV